MNMEETFPLALALALPRIDVIFLLDDLFLISYMFSRLLKNIGHSIEFPGAVTVHVICKSLERLRDYA